MLSRVATSALALALLAHAAPTSAAPELEASTDRVIYGEGKALWSIPAAGGEKSKLADLPWEASTLARLRVASNGSALALNAAGLTAYLDLSPEAPRKLRFLPCSGSSELSADGKRLVCATQDGERIAVYTLRPKLEVEIIDRRAQGPLFFGERQDEIIAFGEKQGLVALSGTGTRELSAHRPDRSMSVAPNGKRVLGAYAEGEIDIVFTFQLKGKAVRRTLMHAARSLSISADSQWAAVQQEVDACAVRIAGGQYMCWRRFNAQDISSEGRALLVSKERGKTTHDLLLGEVRGTSARAPSLLVEEVAEVAAFWPQPGPIAVPSSSQSDSSR